MTKTYCERCEELVLYKVVKNVSMHDDLLDVIYNGTKCICLYCGNEVHDNEIDMKNNEESKRVWELNKR